VASLSVTVSSRLPAVRVEWQLYNSVGTGQDRACIHPIRAEENSETESSARAPGAGS